MASPSLNEPDPSQDDEDYTLVDETPLDDQLGNDSGSGNGVESSRKRKKPTKKKAPQKKAKKGGKERAACWNHFDVVYLEEEDGLSWKYGSCKYCKHEIAADPNRNGTSGLRKHAKACKKNPNRDESQSNLVLQKEASGQSNCIGHIKALSSLVF
ncbi:putative transcription factor/ chromatin remodeling BED-type(Zn) family [Helianthus debilis subsp. tardiflorus]